MDEKLTPFERACLWITAGLAGLLVAAFLVGEAKAHDDPRQSIHPDFFHSEWEEIVCEPIEAVGGKCPYDNDFIVHEWAKCIGYNSKGELTMRQEEEREVGWLYRKHRKAMRNERLEERIWRQYYLYKCTSRTAWRAFWWGTTEYR